MLPNETTFINISLDEAEGAKIRSGIKWAEESEKCTKFFLNLEKNRADDNTIFQLLEEPKNTFLSYSS